MVARVVVLVVVGGLLSAQGAADEIDPNFVGWWRFEEGEGTVAVDSSGQGNDGALMGDPQWVAGYDGLALELDGEGDYVETGKTPLELGGGDEGPRTVTLWVYARRFDGGGVCEMGGEDDRGGLLLCTGVDENQWRVRLGIYWSDFAADSLNEWTHLAYVRDDYFRRVYVNGEWRVIKWDYGETIGDRTFKMGMCEGASFDGLIDDVRVYRRVVEEDEIERIMEGNARRAWAPTPGHVSAPTLDNADALRWSAGAGAIAHDVYFGTERDVVSAATIETEGIYRGRQLVEVTSYVPPELPLEWNTTYYWRIDEVDEGGDVTKGGIWRFTTLDYVTVDDFERYDDIDSFVFDTWLDGWFNGTGSTVGYFETICFPVTEPIWGHTGEQSMPFTYENMETPWYSEASRAWDTPKDLPGLGVDTLTLYLIGEPISFLERADGSVVMGGYGRRSDEPVDQFRFACKDLRGDGAIVVKVDRLGGTGPWDQAGVMMRAGHGEDAKHVGVLVTAGHGVLHQYRTGDGDVLGHRIQDGVRVPYWVRLVRVGDTFTAWHSADGVHWIAAPGPGADSSVKVPMPRDINIGLVVSSDSWRSTTSASFSGVSVEGDVAGRWEIQDIGTWQPGGNDPDRVYVGLVDEAGRVGVVDHPDDPLAVGAAVWERWDIALSEFAAAGVDLTRITEMLIGVGDRDDPVPGGEGMVHFDDIRLTRSEGVSGD